jgi:hypothetical protein
MDNLYNLNCLGVLLMSVEYLSVTHCALWVWDGSVVKQLDSSAVLAAATVLTDWQHCIVTIVLPLKEVQYR